jgi:guanosine-3',5'-bis(diphosphate) 3'-pyrophosphohydrolase
MIANEILKSLMFASEAHKNQRRKGSGGSPYINHLIEVAFLLTDCAQIKDYKIIQAGVLHDILEDTEITEDELREKFGIGVADYVKNVTDDKALSLEDRKAYQIAHLLDAPDGVKLIKLADHCSNIASIPSSWSENRIQSYLSWSHEVASLCFVVSSSLAEEYKLRFQRVR